MSSLDDWVIVTPIFEEDCITHGLPEDDMEALKTTLKVNPEHGTSIQFVRHGEGRLNCAQLRGLPWLYERNGALVRGCALYFFLSMEFPLLLLRFEVDSGKGFDAPWADPASWPKWIELCRELLELALHALT